MKRNRNTRDKSGKKKKNDTWLFSCNKNVIIKNVFQQYRSKHDYYDINRKNNDKNVEHVRNTIGKLTNENKN